MTVTHRRPFVRHQRLLMLVGVVFLLAGALLCVLAAQYDRFFFDMRALRWVQGLGGWFDPIADFSNGPLHTVGLPLVALAALVWCLRGRRFDLAVVVGLAYAMSMLDTVLKELVGRPRPVGTFVSEFPDTSSFPSGHMLGAMMVFGVWVLIAPAVLPRGVAWAVSTACIVAIVITGLSRSWSGAHWPSDWLGSIVLGTGMLCLLAALVPVLVPLDRSRPRRSQPWR